MLLCMFAVPSGFAHILDPEEVKLVDTPLGFECRRTIQNPSQDVYEITFTFEAETARIMPPFTIKWEIPSKDVYTIWTNPITSGRSNYNFTMYGRAGGDVALASYVSKTDRNVFTFGLSEPVYNKCFSTSLSETTASFTSTIDFFGDPFPQLVLKHYEVTLRIDMSDHPYERALEQMALWMRFNYPPASIPDAAMLPVYSTWYNFHHQLDSAQLLREAVLAKELGMDVLILDDGWMTLQDEWDFSYVGEYEPLRIPEMHSWVKSLHDLDMKVMLWYSLSMIGKSSPVASQLQGKYLRDEKSVHIVDPRYPEVREHLIQKLQASQRDWEIDGFKIDFMSKMYLDSDSPKGIADGRDYATVDEATQAWIRQIHESLSRVDPSVLLEIRQPQLNPASQQYANMFRAIDNFNMEIANRIYIAKIKLLSPGLAVHSDMIKWHFSDSVEDAALQFLNGLYAVPQISVVLEALPESHRRMLAHNLSYWRKYRKVLLQGSFWAENPGENYTALHAVSESEGLQISTLYAQSHVALKQDGLRQLHVINADFHETTFLDLSAWHDAMKLDVQLFDCEGNCVKQAEMDYTEFLTLNIPSSGRAELRWR